MNEKKLTRVVMLNGDGNENGIKINKKTNLKINKDKKINVTK